MDCTVHERMSPSAIPNGVELWTCMREQISAAVLHVHPGNATACTPPRKAFSASGSAFTTAIQTHDSDRLIVNKEQ